MIIHNEKLHNVKPENNNLSLLIPVLFDLADAYSPQQFLITCVQQNFLHVRISKASKFLHVFLQISTYSCAESKITIRFECRLDCQFTIRKLF